MSVTTIDCHYLEPGRCAAFLIHEGDQAAFVDNGTPAALPHLLTGLRAHGLQPDQVVYAIVTHAHLDHAAGTAALLRECPNATVLAHPRAARHLIDPTRLEAGVKGVYGEEVFRQLFGECEAVDGTRVRAVEDSETVRLGEETLTFFYTLGHASHHICIHDSGSNGVFAGDTFGVCYETLQKGTWPYIFCAAVPTEFDPKEARLSVQRVVATGADQVFVTHFGTYDDVPRRAKQLLHTIDRMEAIMTEARASARTGPALRKFCEDQVRRVTEEEVKACGLEWNPETRTWLDGDIVMNAAGLVCAVEKARES